MSDSEQAQQLARAWIEGWNAGDPDNIPLAEDFVHTSPLGVLKGRGPYLAKVKPMAAKNVVELTILKVLSEPGLAAIWFEMNTPNGPVQVCDWVHSKDGKITAVNAFYDTFHLPHRETY